MKKIKKITIRVEMTAQGSKDEFTFEVPGDMSEKDIENAAQEYTQEWADDYIDVGYEIVKIEED